MKSTLKIPPLPWKMVALLSPIVLTAVRSYGTEGRRGGDEIPPSETVYPYVVFRGSDVKDLKVEESAKKPEPPPPVVPDDPAIVAVSLPLFSSALL
jgi:protein LSM14